MRVHFGGSITNLKLYPEKYLEIVQAIKGLGHEIVRDWVPEELEGNTIPLDLMYEYTEDAIKNSNAVILDNTLSRTSIGQQLMLAVQHNIPVLLLKNNDIADKNSKSNVFLSKQVSKLVISKKYTSKTLNKVLKEFFEKTVHEFQLSRFNLELDKNLDNYLKKLAKKNRSSKSAEIRKLVLEKMTLDIE
jgi:hypothetical protein